MHQPLTIHELDDLYDHAMQSQLDEFAERIPNDTVDESDIVRRIDEYGEELQKQLTRLETFREQVVSRFGLRPEARKEAA